MTTLPDNIIHLSDRAVLHVAGADAESFLQNIITNDMSKLKVDKLLYACLLSPQGQYLHDFFISQAPDGNGFWLDCEAARVDDLLRRFTMFRLRSKVTFENISANCRVYAAGQGDGLPDPRLATLGSRIYSAEAAATALPVEKYHDFCIDFIVPCGSLAIRPLDTMADVNLDHLNAVAWDKGCFIGQEVAARMFNLGKTKKRLYKIQGEGLEAGGAVLQNGRPVGDIRHVATNGRVGLAQIKIAAAENELLPLLTADGVKLLLTPARYLNPSKP